MKTENNEKLSKVLTGAMLWIALVVSLSYFSFGFAYSPIPIWLWIISILVTFQLWRKSHNNSKAKDLAMCAVLCPVAASIGNIGIIAFTLEPSLSSQIMLIKTLNITLFAVMVGAVVSLYISVRTRQ